MSQWVRSLAEPVGNRIKLKVDHELEPSQAKELAQRLLDLANDIIEKEASGLSDEDRKWGTGHYPEPEG